MTRPVLGSRPRMIRARLFILSPILMVPVTLPTLMVMTAGQGAIKGVPTHIRRQDARRVENKRFGALLQSGARFARFAQGLSGGFGVIGLGRQHGAHGAHGAAHRAVTTDIPRPRKDSSFD